MQRKSKFFSCWINMFVFISPIIFGTFQCYYWYNDALNWFFRVSLFCMRCFSYEHLNGSANILHKLMAEFPCEAKREIWFGIIAFQSWSAAISSIGHWTGLGHSHVNFIRLQPKKGINNGRSKEYIENSALTRMCDNNPTARTIKFLAITQPK